MDLPLLCSKYVYATYSILRAAKSPMEGGKRPSSTLEDKSLHQKTKPLSERPGKRVKEKERAYTVLSALITAESNQVSLQTEDCFLTT